MIGESIGKMRGQAAIECAPRTAGHLKGQAAMEYLMTYGWALLVIVIVIAILLVINPLQPPQGCRFDQVGFTCSDPLLDSNGLLYLKVTNGNNNNVKIFGINCTSDKSPKPPAFDATGVSSILLQRQETFELPGIQCYDTKGAKLVPAAGSDFSGKLWVFYKNEEDGTSYPMRSINANVVAKVVTANPSSTNMCGTIPYNPSTEKCCQSGGNYLVCPSSKICDFTSDPPKCS